MITFDSLWQILKTKGMNKGDLQKAAERSSSMVAKLAKNEKVYNNARLIARPDSMWLKP